jgi:hypothetical protein
MLWRAKIPIRRKILLVAMFGGGVFIMAAGILRCILILRDPVGGAQQAGSWAVRETFVAVIIGNIPMIYPLFRRATRQFLESSFFDSINLSRNTKSQADPNGDFHGGPSGDSHGLEDGKKKFWGGRTLYPLSTIARDESEERIIGADKEGPAKGAVVERVSSTGETSEGTAITVVTETIVHDRERMEGESGLQKSHWPTT